MFAVRGKMKEKTEKKNKRKKKKNQKISVTWQERKNLDARLKNE